MKESFLRYMVRYYLVLFGFAVLIAAGVLFADIASIVSVYFYPDDTSAQIKAAFGFFGGLLILIVVPVGTYFLIP